MSIPNTLGASLFKPYAIAIAPDGASAEIDMYGEVVKSRPKDDDGKPTEDSYIVEAEFLKDLEAIKQSGVKNITLRLNSVGGAVFSAIPIYNKLMEINAFIIAKVDGVSMSAAFFIMQAADVIEVFPSSLLMLHSAAMCVSGYYNAMELHKQIGLLESCDNAIINAIKLKTGKSEKEILKAMQLETYMTGSEAVEMGYADKLVGDDTEDVEIVASADRHTLYAAGREINLPFGFELPENLDIKTIGALLSATPIQNNMQPAPQADISNKSHNNGGKNMEIKTLDELRAAYPDMVAQVEASAKAEGASAERERIKGIDKIANTIGDADLVNDAKFGENPLDAAGLALAACNKAANIGKTVFENIVADASASGAANVVSVPTPFNISNPKDITDDQKAVALLLSRIANEKEEK